MLIRLVTGVGDALFFTGSATLVADMAPPERRGQALSYFSITAYLGQGLGPTLGESVASGVGSSVGVRGGWRAGGPRCAGVRACARRAPGAARRRRPGRSRCVSRW